MELLPGRGHCAFDMFKRIALIVLLLNLAHVAADQGGRFSCEDELDKARLALRGKIESAFSRFSRVPATPLNTHKLIVPWPQGIQTVELERQHPERTPWNKLKWFYRDMAYDFVDVGMRNLELDSLYMNSLVAKHLLTHPDQNLELHFSEAWMQAERILSDWNYMLLRAVKKNYAQKKYLGPEDFYLMDEIGSASSNGDTFALLKSSEREDARPSEREPLMTIQVRYHGDRNVVTPTLKGVLQSQGLDDDQNHDRYPLEYRVAPAERDRFRASLYNAIPPDSTCEIIRYTNFKKFPRY